MPAPTELLNLVERFHRFQDDYHRSRFNETQLRIDYLNPLFRLLGWDMDNQQGLSEHVREVVHEYSLKTPDGSKAPDYGFRIGKDLKFFLEAKKPSVKIKEDHTPAFQLRSYAWNAKLPVSILSDFEEFAIYDCRFMPDRLDRASVARMEYFTFSQLPEKWEWLTNTFSKQAIVGGAFDKYAETTRAKRGTIDVDDAFLAEIEQWRELLAADIAKRNRTLTVTELNDAVQRTIDRIIFLRIAEDRGIEEYGKLQSLTNGKRIYPRLLQIFHQADARYNSGLFHFRKEKGQTEEPDNLTTELEVSDEPLQEIFRKLYYPSPYRFHVMPASVLGQVYEQFLGKVITLDKKHHATVELKPEVRKAGGVYYTPEYIALYIVENTIGKLIYRGIGESGAKNITPSDVAKLHFLDPACGSGSFLLVAYDFLLDWHLNFYSDNPKKWSAGKNAAIYKADDGWRLTTAEKRRILLNNIYGVDIDRQAVEVTKLSLLLKVLEGESDETLGRQMALVHQRVLPDLGNNIKCGNSLISSDFYDTPANADLDLETRKRINAFDWEHEFPEIMKGGGFDAVIGNPPYIRIQRIPHEEADYLFRTYETPASKTDLSLLFLECSLSLLPAHGLAGFICTSQWVATDYGKNMRHWLSDGRLHKFIDFGSLPVFKAADTYPGIFIIGSERNSTLRLKRITSPDDLNLRGIEEAKESSIALDSLGATPWNLGGLDIPSHLTLHSISWTPLQTFGNAYIGLLTGMDAAFVVPSEMAKELRLEEDLLYPYAYRGAEVVRYGIVEPDARVIYPYTEGRDGSPELITESVLKKKYSHIYQHLLSYKSKLRQRMDSRRYYAEGDDWYRHLRPGSFSYIRPTKLLFKGIDTRSTVGYLKINTAFNGANCPGIILHNAGQHSPEYVIALLNSRLLSFHLRMVCPAKLGGYSRFNATNISQTPIRLIDFTNREDVGRHGKIVSLTEQLVNLQGQLNNAKTPQDKNFLQRQIEQTDRKIDQLVYELYGLSQEEIAIVEGG